MSDWHAPAPMTLADRLAVGWDALTALFTVSSWERDDFHLPRRWTR